MNIILFFTINFDNAEMQVFCQNPNLTSTQRLGFTRKLLYNHHHPPQKLNVSNISAVRDQILMKL